MDRYGWRFSAQVSGLIGIAALLLLGACGGGGEGAGAVVTNPPPITVGTVTVALPSATLRAGDALTATAEVRSTAGSVLTGRAITWTSSNTGVATVSGAGQVTGVAAGSAIIAATADGVSGSATLTVTPPPVGTIAVTTPTSQLSVARSMSAVVVVRDDRNAPLTGRALTWTSSDAAVAMVDGTGVITGIALGSATITASAEGKSGSVAITVVPPPVQTVSVALAAGSIPQGSTTTATATLQDDRGVSLAGRSVSWSSNAPSIATVDAAGTVAAVGVGSATIIATSEGKTGSATLTVVPVPVASVTVSLAQSALLPGGTTSATATAFDASGRTLTGRTVSWSSSATSVATVNASGTVQAVAFGTAIISATVEGRSGQASLTVAPPVASVVFSGALRQKVGDSYAMAVTARAADGTVLTRAVTWRMKESGRASVTADGVVTPLQSGTFTLAAVIDGAEWTANYTSYDWSASNSGGMRFLQLEADATIANKFGTLDTPQLIASCDATSSIFFLWIRTPHIITANGIVAYGFDSGAPIGDIWDELSPNFNTLWKRGASSVVKAFAMQMATTRRFSLAFGEFQSSSRVASWRVTGMAPLLSAMLAACPLALQASAAPLSDSLVTSAMARVLARLPMAATGAVSDEAVLRAATPASARSPMLNAWPVWAQPDVQEARRVMR